MILILRPQRIFSYASHLEKAVTAASCLAAFGSGLTMPLMYILFGMSERSEVLGCYVTNVADCISGKLTGTFTNFFKQGTQETEAEFLQAVNQTVYVVNRPKVVGMEQKKIVTDCVFRLQIGYVFLLKLSLTYLSNVGASPSPRPLSPNMIDSHYEARFPDVKPAYLSSHPHHISALSF